MNALFGFIVGVLLTVTVFGVTDELETRELRPRPRIIETIVHGQDARMWLVKVIGHMTITPRGIFEGYTEEICVYSIINEIKESIIYSNTWGEIGRAVEDRLAYNGDALYYGFGCKFITRSVHVSDAEEVVQ